MSNFDPWLRALAAAGKGGGSYPQLAIDRGRAWSKTLEFGDDYSGDAFAANLALEPDGAVLVAVTVGSPSFADGVTSVPLSLTAVQTANASLIPADGDLDGVEHLAFELVRTPSGGSAEVFFGGVIPVRGKV